MDFIPVNEPLLDGNEKKYLNECIDTGWISSEGSFVKQLENGMASYVGRKFGIAVCNGSLAIDAAIAALGIKKNDEVIMPAFTIISCANAIIRAGAKPVLVDSDPLTWCMDVNQIEDKITDRTKAIMVVHIYGLPVDMNPVIKIADKYGLKIIEDAAEAHGLEYKGTSSALQTGKAVLQASTPASHGKKCGSFGDISTFSFYPNKHVTTGEGGMILTDGENLANKCASLRNLCFLPQRRFVHEEMGWNLRMSNLQAAVGVAQLERLDEFVSKKKIMGKQYTELLNDIKEIQLPVAKTDYAENIYWVYGLILNKEVPFDAAEAMKKLSAKGIGTRPFFYPMHKQPVFNKMGLFKDEHYPVAENLAERGFYIPSGLALNNEQIENVAKAVRSLFK